MEYSSIIFLFGFLPVFLALYYIFPWIQAKNILLFVFSLAFYFWGAGTMVVLLPVIGLLAWFFSWILTKTKRQGQGLVLTVAVMTFIGILVYHKYMGFIIDNLISAGVTGIQRIQVLATLGISFYTFQAISYVADVYRKEKRFEKNPLYVILYITMFPQLISGPLVRYQEMRPQFTQRNFDMAGFSEGIRRFIIGLGKKVLIANPLSFLVGQIIASDTAALRPETAWIGMIAFAIVIFFDLSGYTDMAIGAGRMLGFKLPENFNYPYISRSITEFWRRWHITFSNWIKDYIFTPLATKMRNRGQAGVVIGLLVTFIVCGAWHNPGWNFLLWGLTQGIFLVLEQLFLLKWLKRIRGFAILYTLFVMVCCLVLFRTADLSHAAAYYSAMFSAGNIRTLGLDSFFMNEHVVVLILGILFCIPMKLPARLKKGSWIQIIPVISTVLLILIFILSIMNMVAETHQPFIYFQF